MLKITMQQIGYFLALCNTLNFTETAKKCYLSQPALSRQISILENKVGFPLFIRDHRNVILTAEGKLLQKEFQELLNHYNKLMTNITLIAHHEIGELRIGCLEYLNISKIFKKSFNEFYNEYPKTKIITESYNFNILFHNLFHDKLDCIVIPYYEINGKSDLEWEQIDIGQLGIIIPKSNPLSAKKEVTFQDLKHQPFFLISKEESSGFANWILSICKRNNFIPDNIQYVPNIASLLFSLKNGLGVTICNQDIIKYGENMLKSYSLSEKWNEMIIAVWKKDNTNYALENIINIWKNQKKLFVD